MAPRQKRGFWRTCRIYFRRVRITGWLLLLALIGALAYLNQVGLPGFVKAPLLERLHARGLDLQFSRLRLSWYRGIVAEDVHFGPADEPLGPQLRAAEVQVQLSHEALARFQLQVDSLVLRRGRLDWPIVETNQPTRELAVTNIQTVLRFLANDQWTLDKFRANFAGASFQVTGTITNASAMRDWQALQAAQPRPVAVWQDRVRQIADALEAIHFPAPPGLRLDFRGDARDLRTFGAHLVVTAPGADTPWGVFSQGRLSARLFPATSNDVSSAEITLEAGAGHTRWAAGTNVQLVLHLASYVGQSNVVSCDLSLAVGQAQTRWAGVTNAQFTAHWVHCLTNPVPLSGQGQLYCERATTEWVSARNVQLNGGLAISQPSSASPQLDTSLAWWTNLQPYYVTWQFHLTDVIWSNLAAAEISCGGSWCAPELTLTNLYVKLGRGHLEANADLNVATRVLNAGLFSDLDPQELAPALPAPAQRRLTEVSLGQPPQLKGSLSLVLPAWTNRQPDWSAEVRPTLCLDGEVKLDRGGAYRGISFTAAQSRVLCSNLCWHLRDLAITRPEGRISADFRADERTKDFWLRMSSSVDPFLVQPLLGTNRQTAFDLFTFTQPPHIEGELWGRFHDSERFGLKGRAALTNFTFRGIRFRGLQTGFQYTNLLLQCFEPRVQPEEGSAMADGVAADFRADLVFLTNGFSTADPLVIAGAIGEDIRRAILPYQFKRPPTAHVYGSIPMHGEEGADLHFELEGGPFHWLKFNVPQIAGHLHWKGEQLTMKDVRTEFYGGQASGQAAFLFHPNAGTDLQFSLTTTNTQLHRLMTDLSSATNKLEGQLSGSLFITNANTAEPARVCGYGNARLRDGLIWEFPLFGIFTPILDGMIPGLGSSRANAGTCSFVITNSVIRSDDLQIRASGARLKYRGTVDFDYRVNARVEAELLRDVWLVGPVVSTVLKPVTTLFEYKVTGTLDTPRLAPVYIVPKLVLLPFQLPFHPWRTLKSFLPEDTSRTNAPPVAR